MTVRVRFSLALLATFVVAGCNWLEAGVRGLSPEASGRHPDVIAVELRPVSDRLYDVVVTISSPYDTPQRYADGWRVLDTEGHVLGTHTLLHDHAAEQPFTRTMHGLRIPAGVSRITVEGRDLANGYGGATVSLDVPA